MNSVFDRISQFSDSGKTAPITFKYILLCTALCALAAHLYCWTNSLFSHDSLMVVQNDWEHQIGIGRPFQQFYVALRGAIVAPWLIGMLGTLFLALANWEIIKLLRIPNRLYVLAICAALTTNATITLVNATYLDWFDIMMLALFLSCVSINLCNRHTWYCSAAAALLLCLSAGLYQSYLSAAVTLTLISCAQRLLSNQKKECLHFGIRAALTIIAGLLLYLIAQKIAFVLAGDAEYHTYNSVSAAFSSGMPIYQVIFIVWLDFWAKLVWPETYAIPLIGACNLALLAIGFIGFLSHVRNNTSKTNALLAAIILVLLPLAMNCVNIASYPTMHSLMIFSYYLFYPAVFAILQPNNPTVASTPTANSPWHNRNLTKARQEVVHRNISRPSLFQRPLFSAWPPAESSMQTRSTSRRTLNIKPLFPL